jgi:hypothetical protein
MTSSKFRMHGEPLQTTEIACLIAFHRIRGAGEAVMGEGVVRAGKKASGDNVEQGQLSSLVSVWPWPEDAHQAGNVVNSQTASGLVSDGRVTKQSQSNSMNEKCFYSSARSNDDWMRHLADGSEERQTPASSTAESPRFRMPRMVRSDAFRQSIAADCSADSAWREDLVCSRSATD